MNDHFSRQWMAVCAAVLLCGATLVAQGAWSQLPQGNPPSPRSSAWMMAYDQGNDRAVLFGGDPGNGGNYLSDCRLLDCATNIWTVGPVGPSARAYHSLTYDAARQQVILFGGRVGSGGGGPDAETWAFSGSSWTRLRPVNSPPARLGHSAVFDSFRSRIVLFGGATAAGNTNETWEWDGTNWTQSLATFPAAARRQSPIAYDSARRRVVVFGGRGTSASTLYNGTFEFDGTTWFDRTGTIRPPARVAGSMAYHEALARVVLHAGGGATAPLSDTWYWDGADWVQQFPTPPSGRAGAGMVFDSMRSRLVMFSGAATSDLWEFAHAVLAGYRTFGSGCAGNAVAPTLALADHRLPWLGDFYDVAIGGLPPIGSYFFVTGFDNQTWNGSPLPVSLAGVGMPGCQAWINPNFFSIHGNSVSARVRATVPNTPILIGVSIFHQAVVMNPAAGNPLGGLVSNAGQATFGMR